MFAEVGLPHFILTLIAVAAVSLGSVLLASLVLLVDGPKQRLTQPLMALAAGVLIATAVVIFIPHALEVATVDKQNLGGFWPAGGMLVGILVVAVLLNQGKRDQVQATDGRFSLVTLQSGDGLHRFIEGTLLGAVAFVDVGLFVFMLVGFLIHDVPKETAKMALMKAQGQATKRILLINLLVAAITLIGAAVGYLAFDAWLLNLQPTLMMAAAGVFLVVALQNLLPSLRRADPPTVSWTSRGLILLGAAIPVILHEVILLSGLHSHASP